MYYLLKFLALFRRKRPNTYFANKGYTKPEDLHKLFKFRIRKRRPNDYKSAVAYYEAKVEALESLKAKLDTAQSEVISAFIVLESYGKYRPDNWNDYYNNIHLYESDDI